VWAVAKLSFFSSDSCNFCFMWMIWKKFSENTVVFLSIIWCKFQEFKLHGFREIKFFLGGCFLCRTLYIYTCILHTHAYMLIITATRCIISSHQGCSLSLDVWSRDVVSKRLSLISVSWKSGKVSVSISSGTENQMSQSYTIGSRLQANMHSFLLHCKTACTLFWIQGVYTV